jgi:nucleoside-diphosphate-sugar epimerase
MVILVTGASGFLGTHCVSDLARRGHRVLTTDRRGPAAFLGDLGDPAFTAGLPDVDTVVHAAAVQYVSPDLPIWNRGRWFHRNNVVATRNLVERYRATRAHFIFVSTSMIYADHEGMCEAASPRGSQGTYSASKLAAEAYVTGACALSATVVPCIIAGEGRGGLFVPFVRSMRKLGVALVPGQGRNKVHLVHVEDVASLITLIAERRATGAYNAGGKEPVSIQEWIDEIEVALGLPPVRRLIIPLALVRRVSASLGYIPLAREQLSMLHRDHVLGIASSSALGWAPKWTNREIVQDTARSLAQDRGRS